MSQSKPKVIMPQGHQCVAKLPTVNPNTIAKKQTGPTKFIIYCNRAPRLFWLRVTKSRGCLLTDGGTKDRPIRNCHAFFKPSRWYGEPFCPLSLNEHSTHIYRRIALRACGETPSPGAPPRPIRTRPLEPRPAPGNVVRAPARGIISRFVYSIVINVVLPGLL